MENLEANKALVRRYTTQVFDKGDVAAVDVAFMTVTRTLHEEVRVFGFTFAGDGQSYTVNHVHIYRVAEGKIREHWAVRDDLSMLRQLGALSQGAPDLARRPMTLN
jgi:hypothetical protein